MTGWISDTRIQAIITLIVSRTPHLDHIDIAKDLHSSLSLSIGEFLLYRILALNILCIPPRARSASLQFIRSLASPQSQFSLNLSGSRPRVVFICDYTDGHVLLT